jgi:iron complex outermembrane recepter protein
MTRLATRTLLYLVILTLGFPALPLLAQEQQQPKTAEQQQKAAEEEKKPKVTEEMVVTARKREETVQSVPMSVAAPTESELRDRGAETMEDIAANVAGFSVQNLGPGQSQVAMRGVSSGQIVRDQPGVKEQVGVYLDESVISMSLFTPDLDLFDMNRVEVLRGPQGTLFGSGSESGTMRYISNQPKLGVTETIGEFTGAAVDQGGHGGSGKVALNMPINDTTAMRFAGYYTRYPGFMTEIHPDLSRTRHANSGERSGGRVSFLFKPNAKLSITPRLLYQDVEMNGWNRIDVYNILANPFTATRPQVSLGDRTLFTQIAEPFSDKFGLADVNISYDLGGGKTFSAISSYINRKVDVLRDATALTASITGGSIGLPPAAYNIDAPLDDHTKAHGFTQEARLSGNAAKVQWVVGAFYGNNHRDYGQDLNVTGFQAVTGIPTKGIAAPKDVLFFSDLHYKLKQDALFGEGTYAVNDRLDLTGGLRWYNYDEKRQQVFDGLFVVNTPGVDQPVSQPGSVKANGFAPRAILNYKLTDANRVYGQISKGFRLGGINDPINAPLCTPADLVTFSGHDSWKDETLWNYEVGSKNRIAGGRGSLNAAAFYADIKDLQATVTAGSCSSRLIFNVPKARSTGAEMEFELAPTDRFDFAVTASHTDSKLRSTVTSAGIRSGDRMPSVPEDQGAAAATWRWPTPGWVGYLTGVYQHIGDRFTQVGDEDLGAAATIDLLSFEKGGGKTIGGPLNQTTFTFDPKLPAYDIVNLRFGILKGRWDTAFFVDNVTDERALLSLDRERGFRARIGYLTNQSRTFGISTRFVY